MFGRDFCVARFSLLNGFLQMRNRFLQMRAFASPLSVVQRLSRMCHKHLSMTLFAVVYRLLHLHEAAMTFPVAVGWAFSMDTATNSPSANRMRATRENLLIIFAPPFMVRMY
jgi:hypothetical protein